MGKRKNKRGYTLVELVVVLGVLSILTFICLPALEVYEDKRVAVDTEYAVEGVIEFINCGRAYARNKSKSVSIQFRENRLVMMAGLTKVNEFIFSDVVKEFGISSGGKIITINSDGQIASTTITLICKRGEQIKITVKVGTSYVSRQKER